MNTQKYTNMAYRNPEGRRWLQTLHSPKLWNRWKTLLYNDPHTPNEFPIGALETYAHLIVTEALWYLGVSGRTSKFPRQNLAEVAQAREKGGGGNFTGVLSAQETTRTSPIPWEFVALDNFLEYIVRPIIAEEDAPR